MRKAFNERLYLTNGQRRILDAQREAWRFVSNHILAARRDADTDGNPLGLYDTITLLPGMNGDRPSRTLVHSMVLQHICQRVHLAFDAFVRRAQRGEAHVGYPRFKQFGRYDSITYPQYGNGVRGDGERLIVTTIGAVTLVVHRPIEGTPKTVTLTRSATGKWYACLSCETEAHPLEPTGLVVGVDVGVLHFATLSNGEPSIENPRFYRRDDADVTRVQQRTDAAKNAQNWPENTTQKAILSRMHERIGNRRSDVAHTERRTLVNAYQVLVCEDLAPLDMGTRKGRGMRKRIMDGAWTQCISMTIGNAAEAGRTVIVVDPRNTSTMCSACGTLVQKTVRTRTHTCPACGLVLDRDVHAALTIVQRGLQTRRL